MTKHRITVVVKQVHIAEGVRGDPYYCPLTHALEDATGQWGNCWVGLCSASVTIPGEHMFLATLPEEARQWNSDFDAGVPVEPAAFTLEFSEREGGD